MLKNFLQAEGYHINEKCEWAETRKGGGFGKYEGKFKYILIALNITSKENKPEQPI